VPRTALAAPERFEGFADRDGRFFRALATHQTRPWFDAHRHEYEAGWAAPMKALLVEVRDRIDRFFPHLPLAEPKVFRIYRDVRFSKDKSPYKTHIGGYVAVEGGGRGPAVASPLYLHIAGTERFACAGHYMMDADQLARFRRAVLDERRGASLATLAKKLVRAGYAVGSHETLAKVPRGIDPAHPRADLLKRKGIIVTFPALPRELLVSRGLVDWLVKQVKPIVPLVEWLAETAE
jgi:uncharacterized protein (TIGR02453 family)